MLVRTYRRRTEPELGLQSSGSSVDLQGDLGVGNAKEESAQPILSVQNLGVSLRSAGRRVPLVRDVSFDVKLGQTVGIVGETGSGKSMTAKAILRLLDPPLAIDSGKVLFRGQDLFQANERALQKIRGADIGVIFQNPKASLHPMLSVEKQMVNVYRHHRGDSRQGARVYCLEMLRRTGIPDPERVAAQYPHQLSGGMAQRVMIAIGLMCSPSLVIADEPTTGLDVTIQMRVLDVLMRLLKETHAGAVIITHDLGVVANFCDHVVVLYGGRVMEQGPTVTIFARPKHPYTISLLSSSSLETRRAYPELSLRGAPFDLFKPPSGCVLHPRCPFAVDLCAAREPELCSVGDGVEPHASRCYFAEEL